MADKRKKLQLLGFWGQGRGLSLFLAFLVLMTIFVPTVRPSRPERVAVDFTFALMLVSGAIATIRQRILMYLVIATAVLEFTADSIVEFDPSLIHWEWDTAVKVSGMAILLVMTLMQTFRPGPVSVHRVMGGVAAYLLIGMTWAFGYKLLMQAVPDAIHFQPPLAGIPTDRDPPTGL